MALERSDFKDWLDNPVTQEVIKCVQFERKTSDDFISNNRSFDPTMVAILMRHMGFVDACDQLLNLDWDLFSANVEALKQYEETKNDK